MTGTNGSKSGTQRLEAGQAVPVFDRPAVEGFAKPVENILVAVALQ